MRALFKAEGDNSRTDNRPCRFVAFPHGVARVAVLGVERRRVSRSRRRRRRHRPPPHRPPPGTFASTVAECFSHLDLALV